MGVLAPPSLQIPCMWALRLCNCPLVKHILTVLHLLQKEAVSLRFLKADVEHMWSY